MKTDTQIQTDVMQELKWDPSVTHTNIGVAVSDGIVTLTGHVPTYMEKTSAEDAAQRVAGVKAIANEMEVKISSLYHRDDEDIARAAVDAIKWNVQVPDDVKVTVESGWVTLKGQVEWGYQKNAAENAVRSLTGVCGVSNQVAIKPRVLSSDVKTKIEDALKRSAEREARRINVNIQGGKVTLSGQVRSFAELRDAKGAAFAAPGVTEVEANLRVAA